MLGSLHLLAPIPQSLKTEGSNDMNTKEDEGGPLSSQALDRKPLAPQAPVPNSLPPSAQTPCGEIKGYVLRVQGGKIIQVDITWAQVLVSLQGT